MLGCAAWSWTNLVKICPQARREPRPTPGQGFLGVNSLGSWAVTPGISVSQLRHRTLWLSDLGLSSGYSATLETSLPQYLLVPLFFLKLLLNVEWSWTPG